MARPSGLHGQVRRTGGRVSRLLRRAGARRRGGRGDRRAEGLGSAAPALASAAPRAGGRWLCLLLLPLLFAAEGCRSTTPNLATLPIGTCFEHGLASWYGPGFHGRRTANGERFTGKALTAAHRTLPFGTVVEVRNLDNEKSVRVRINDRGPFVRKRILDLSRTAAEAIEMLGRGVARIELCYVEGAPIPTPGLFTVQVGAFQETERAASLSAELGRNYRGVKVISDGTWNRVQVNLFEDRDSADRFREELERLGYAAIVVRVDPEPVSDDF